MNAFIAALRESICGLIRCKVISNDFWNLDTDSDTEKALSFSAQSLDPYSHGYACTNTPHLSSIRAVNGSDAAMSLNTWRQDGFVRIANLATSSSIEKSS